MIDAKHNRVIRETEKQKYGQKAHAKFNFDSFDSAQLSLKQNDVLRVFERVNADWFRARTSDARYGLVPAAYVEFDKEDLRHSPLSNVSSLKASLKNELEEWISSSSLLSISSEQEDKRNESLLSPHAFNLHEQRSGHSTPSQNCKDSNRLKIDDCFDDNASQGSFKSGSTAKEQLIIKSNNDCNNDELAMKSNYTPSSNGAVADLQEFNELDKSKSNSTSIIESESTDMGFNFLSVFDSCSHLWNDNDKGNCNNIRERLKSSQFPKLREVHERMNGNQEEKERQRFSSSSWLSTESPRSPYEHHVTSGRADEHTPYTVVREYKTTNPDELPLEPGELIYVTERFDDGWYVGISHSSNKFGMFPSNCVSKQFDMIGDDYRSTKP